MNGVKPGGKADVCTELAPPEYSYTTGLICTPFTYVLQADPLIRFNSCLFSIYTVPRTGIDSHCDVISFMIRE